MQSLADSGGFRSVVSVPMLREGGRSERSASAGAEPAMFSERQIAMLQTFADQAVIAIENTRLFNELQTRNRDLTESLEQQTATSEILRVISQSQRDVQPVFETIAANARSCAGADVGQVFMFDGEAHSSRGRAQRSIRADSRHADDVTRCRRAVVAPSAAPCSTGAVSYIPDVREDPEYRLQSIAQAAGFRSVAFRADASRRQPDRCDHRRRHASRRCSPKGRSPCSRPSPTRR